MTEKETNKMVMKFLLEDFWRKIKRKNILQNLLFAGIVLVSVFLIGEIENLTKKNEVRKGTLLINTKFENNLEEEKETIKEEIKEEVKSSNANENIYSLININTASVEMLQSLNGIGESYAKKIVEYRKANGSFKTIEEIKNVSGIGDAKFSKIKKYIEV